MKKVGSVNPCGQTTLYDKDNRIIGCCIDTPNVFAAACISNPLIHHGVSYYPMFGESIRYASDSDIQDRISMLNRDLKWTNELLKSVKI